MDSGGVKYKFSSDEIMKWNIQYNTTVGFIHIKVHINICTFWTNTGRLFEIISYIKPQQGNVFVTDRLYKTGSQGISRKITVANKQILLLDTVN